jgi:hypothetical protein
LDILYLIIGIPIGAIIGMVVGRFWEVKERVDEFLFLRIASWIKELLLLLFDKISETMDAEVMADISEYKKIKITIANKI